MKIYIGPDDSKFDSKIYTPQIVARYRKLANRALNEWASLTPQSRSFVCVDKPQAAHIVCEWTTNQLTRKYSFTGGETSTLTFSDGSEQKAISLIFLDPRNIRTDYDFYAICIHELGHAYGLRHSSHPDDCMYGAAHLSQSRFPKLTANDITEFKKRYQKPLGAKSLVQ